MWYAIISAEATLLGLFTSRTDAVLGKPNQAGGELIASCKPAVR